LGSGFASREGGEVRPAHWLIDHDRSGDLSIGAFEHAIGVNVLGKSGGIFLAGLGRASNKGVHERGSDLATTASCASIASTASQ
jgi:hypothetical protein